MASKSAGKKISAVEVHTAVVGNSYRKSNDDFGIVESGSGSGNRVGETDGHEAIPTPSRAELATALQEIEGRKTKWYSYLTTKDFYIVLVLGHVLFLFSLQSFIE